MALVRFSTADSESTKARAMAFGQVLQDFPLARGQPTNRRVRQAGPPRKQQLDNTRIDDPSVPPLPL